VRRISDSCRSLALFALLGGCHHAALRDMTPADAAGSGGDGGSAYPVATGGADGAAGGGAMDAHDAGPPVANAPFQAVDHFFPTAINADGTVVVGFTYVQVDVVNRLQRPARWTAAMGVVLFPGFEADAQGAAAAVSADGKIAIGGGFRWPTPDTQEPLGFDAVAMSADGAVVAGTSQGATFFQGQSFRRLGGTNTPIAPLAGDDGNEVTAMSADGSTIAGHSWSIAMRQEHTFVWSAATGLTEELSFPGVAEADVLALSADGSVLAGEAIFGTPAFPGVQGTTAIRPFRWTRATGVVYLETGNPQSMARFSGVSADGSTIGAAEGGKAYVWKGSGVTTAAPPQSYTFLFGSQLDPSGRTLAVSMQETFSEGGTGDLAVWRFDGSSLVSIDPWGPTRPRYLAPGPFSTDGHTMASTSHANEGGMVLLTLP